MLRTFTNKLWSDGSSEIPREINAMSKPAVKLNQPSEQPIPAQAPGQATHDEIAQRAYQLYLLRGGAEGHDLEDWLQAEQEIVQETTATAIPENSQNRTRAD
jgi:hypothetical protein